jgi:hypothetical protein
MAGGIPRAVRMIASRVGREPGVGPGRGRRRWSQRARHLRFGSHRTAPHADDRRTAPPRCAAARHERIDPPPWPALHRAGRATGPGSTLWPAATARSSVFSQAIDNHALMSASASSYQGASRMLDSSEGVCAGQAGSNIQLLPYPLFIMATGPTDLPGYAQGLEPTAAVAGSNPAAPAG